LRSGRFRLDADGRLDGFAVPPDVLGYAREQESHYYRCPHDGTHGTDRAK
jgi:hypothetical protein